MLLALAASLLLACDADDRGVGTTESDDFTLVLQVPDRFIHVGDEAPITVRVRRTDNSNLARGTLGEIVLTTTAHGSVDSPNLAVDVTDDTTAEFVQTVVFTASGSGMAEVRASFLDATARVEIFISAVNP